MKSEGKADKLTIDDMDFFSVLFYYRGCLCDN